MQQLEVIIRHFGNEYNIVCKRCELPHIRVQKNKIKAAIKSLKHE